MLAIGAAILLKYENWFICRLTAKSIATYRNKTSIFEYIYAGGTKLSVHRIIIVLYLIAMHIHL